MNSRTRDNDMLKAMMLPATVLTSIAIGLLLIATSIGSAVAG